MIWLHIAFTFKCVTWDVSGDEIYFIFRTSDFSESVTLKDNDGNIQTICSFEESFYHCYPIPTSLVINPNIIKNEIKFLIKDFRSMDMDGTWSISQGDKTFNTNVSLSNGKNILITDAVFAIKIALK